MSNPTPTIYAVALLPPAEAGGAPREVRVLVENLFGAACLADTIGAFVREVDAAGVPFAGDSRAWFISTQRLVESRPVAATGRRVVSARELAEKRAAYVASLECGPLAWAVTAARRKPRLPPESLPPRTDWTARHEANQEAVA